MSHVRQKVDFYVRQLEDIVTIQLKTNEHERRKISGFPRNML